MLYKAVLPVNYLKMYFLKCNAMFTALKCTCTYVLYLCDTSFDDLRCNYLMSKIQNFIIYHQGFS